MIYVFAASVLCAALGIGLVIGAMHCSKKERAQRTALNHLLVEHGKPIPSEKPHKRRHFISLRRVREWLRKRRERKRRKSASSPPAAAPQLRREETHFVRGLLAMRKCIRHYRRWAHTLIGFGAICIAMSFIALLYVIIT